MFTLSVAFLTFCNQAVPDQVMTCSKCVTQVDYDERFQIAYHLNLNFVQVLNNTCLVAEIFIETS